METTTPINQLAHGSLNWLSTVAFLICNMLNIFYNLVPSDKKGVVLAIPYQFPYCNRAEDTGISRSDSSVVGKLVGIAVCLYTR